MQPFAIAFTGTAADLRGRTRRAFLVNVLLGGLYTPVQRRIAAQYLLGHTTVDGTPLVDVPVRKSRWPAILLVLAFLAVRVAAEFGSGPPLPLVIVAGVLLLPYLWATTARTIDAIRWRDLALSFAPGLGEVYRASWPLFVLGGAWAIAAPAVTANAPDPAAMDLRWAVGAALALVMAFPLLALLAFQWRRLRFTRTRVGEHAVSWAAHFGLYLRLWVLTALGVLVTAVAPVLALRFALFGSIDLRGMDPTEAAAVYSVALVLAFLLSVPVRSWYEARVFMLSWNGLRVGDVARVECALDVRGYVRLRTLGAWRTLLTLGRFGPRATVEAHAARLAALHLSTT